MKKEDVFGALFIALIFTVTLWAAKEHFTNIKNIAKCGKDWKETGCE
jgi:hypothetical protein